MLRSTPGLQSHIWNNNMLSVVLLCAYPLLILGMVWAGVFLLGYGVHPGMAKQYASDTVYTFGPIILAVVLIWFAISYFFHTQMIRGLAKSHPVSRKEEPELYNLLENLCIAEGMPMPRLEIIETHARNAFASGIDQKTYAVTVTRGLLNSLTKEEVEAVLAHELAHIVNRDVRLLIVTVVFTGMIGLAAQLAWRNLRYGFLYNGNRRGKGNGVLIMLGMVLILWIGYLATMLMRFALSRRREYMADAGAVQMTKNPEAMMSALMRIAGRDRIPGIADDVAMMCIENHVPFMGLFATHPPIERRIRAIAAVTRTEIPQVLSKPPAPHKDKLKKPPRQNPWLARERGSRRKTL